MKSRFLFPVLVIVLSFGASYALAYSTWTGPTAAPPGNNTDAPINVGATTQTKSGDICTNAGGGRCLSNVATPTVQLYAPAVGCTKHIVAYNQSASFGPSITMGNTPFLSSAGAVGADSYWGAVSQVPLYVPDVTTSPTCQSVFLVWASESGGACGTLFAPEIVCAFLI